MPYAVKKRGEEYVVVTQGTGKVHGKFKSRAAALKQLRALYANAPPEKEKAKMAKLDAAARKEIPDEDFAGPGRSFPIKDQDHLEAAARMLGRIKDPAKRKAIKARAAAIAKRKGLKLPETWTKKKAAAMSTVDSDPTGALAVFDLGPGVWGDEFVEYRDSLLFRCGDYPDKKFAMTPEELYVAAANFTPCPIGLEHVPNVLDGALGEVREVRLSDDGMDLLGTVAIPAAIAAKIPPEKRKVSCEFDRTTKELQKLDLVLNPRVRDACLMAAFARPANGTPHGRMRMQMIHDTAAEGGALCDPNKSPKFTSGKERSGLQAIHDMAASHGATCRVSSGGRAAYSKGGGRMSFKNIVAAWFNKGMPDDFDPADDIVDDDPTVVLSDDRKKAPSGPTEAERRLQAQVAQLQDRLMRSEAAAFADGLIPARATPAERQDLIDEYLQAARDDASSPAKVKFSGSDGKGAEGSRVDALKARLARRPERRLDEDLLPSHRVVLSNDDSDPEGIKELDAAIERQNKQYALKNGRG